MILATIRKSFADGRFRVDLHQTPYKGVCQHCRPTAQARGQRLKCLGSQWLRAARSSGSGTVAIPMAPSLMPYPSWTTAMSLAFSNSAEDDDPPATRTTLTSEPFAHNLFDKAALNTASQHGVGG